MRTDKGVKKVQVYIVLGIGLGGTKDLLGFYIGYGRENKAFWMEVMRDMTEKYLAFLKYPKEIRRISTRQIQLSLPTGCWKT